jgi:hypothetical protein
MKITLCGTFAALSWTAVCSAGAVNAAASRDASRQFTAEQDHQNMMDQLGIKVLRPGPSGDDAAPNHANYDEATANPYPNLPDALTLKNGQKVTTAEMWWKQRRPEIVEDFEREVYGRVPKNVPKVTWTVAVTDKEFVGFVPVIAKQLIGHVDNSAYPLIGVDISMTLVVPANAKGPVPVLMIGRSGLHLLTPQGSRQINKKLRTLLAKDDPALQAIFAEYPGYSVIASSPTGPFLARAQAGDLPPMQQLIAAGWGYAALSFASIQADNGAGTTRGIIGLVNQGQLRKPEDWGALRAWAWGASRGLDYLETDPAVAAKHVGIEGVSRFGKARRGHGFGSRFAMALIDVGERRINSFAAKLG